MRLFKRLKAFNQQEAEGTVFGFGILRAKDYDNDRYGHLIIVSINLGRFHLLKKLFVAV